MAKNTDKVAEKPIEKVAEKPIEKVAEKPKVDKYFIKKNAFTKRNFHIDGKVVPLHGGQEISKELYFRFPKETRGKDFEIKKV